MHAAFDPHAQYPSPLRRVVHHAERFAGLLVSLEQQRSAPWLVGRREELQLVLERTLAAWHAGSGTPEGAADAIDSYLRAAHAGARQNLGLDVDTLKSCCLGHRCQTARRVCADDSFDDEALEDDTVRMAAIIEPQPVIIVGVS